MRDEHNNDIENHFLKKMEEKEKNSRKSTDEISSHYSFSLFNLTQQQDPTVEGRERNKNIPKKDIIVHKESQKSIHSHPTFFPPPKVVDMEVNQENKLSKTNESLDGLDEQESQHMMSDYTVKGIPDDRSRVDHSTADDDHKGIDPFVVEEVLIKGSEIENENASIRKEIFMMLEEELEEEGNLLLPEQENDHEQIGIPNDAFTTSLEEETLYSNLDFDYEVPQRPLFNQFLETIYCEKESNPIENEETNFVHSIGSLTSVLKKISTDQEMINPPQDNGEEIKLDLTKHTALKEHFENELFSAEQQMEDVIEATLPDLCSLTVKIPVVLATLHIEVAIFEDFDLPFQIEHIQSIHWSIQPLKTHIPTTSSIVFVKGTLVASIEYVNPGETSSVHCVKIPIQWNHTIPIRWIFPPNIPMNDQREYTFSSQSNQGMSTHHESHQSFCETIHHSLQDFKFISQQAWLKRNGMSTLKIQGCLQLCLHLTQEQFVQIPLHDSLY